MLAWLAKFIGTILAAILPALFDEARKPKKTKIIGADDELQKDINDDITNSINSSIGMLPQDKHNKTPTPVITDSANIIVPL